MANQVKKVTARAPVNIAVIKYWGKNDEKLITPINNSISATLSIDDLCATTTISISPMYQADQFWLNGEEQTISENKRLSHCLQKFRALKSEIKDHLKIESHNNFPTAAGLASSAAGYACLISALGSLFGISDSKQLSILARQGSGSACRSVYGGFVEWFAGNDSETSFAAQIVDENHWPSLRVIILIVNDKEKDVPSTSAMKRSVETSELIRHRAENVVPERCKKMREAIKTKDFEKFAELTMKDSNQFHAIAQDTYPPVRYMNDVSWSIVSLIHGYNDFVGSTKVAYTFDAGPNAVLFMEEDQVGKFMIAVNHFFPINQLDCLFRGQPIPKETINQGMIDYLSKKINIKEDSLKGIIYTKIGCGPKIAAQESN
ncbi:diphosphomevalonate decarboxylase [Tetranychus urticae]|uniref:Diphosphomevalonate decarboxylase n=1 Tax=Tetranychus urticae TaxID=32264 RepID=T1KZ27_TETUR|nr:diphosphomevalonate decarboxylase [Tetranychus urticae]